MKIPLNKLPVVDGYFCQSSECVSVHFDCPYCHRKGSVLLGKVTSVFSMICDDIGVRNNGKSFLVDARDMQPTTLRKPS